VSVQARLKACTGIEATHDAERTQTEPGPSNKWTIGSTSMVLSVVTCMPVTDTYTWVVNGQRLTIDIDIISKSIQSDIIIHYYLQCSTYDLRHKLHIVINYTLII